MYFNFLASLTFFSLLTGRKGHWAGRRRCGRHDKKQQQQAEAPATVAASATRSKRRSADFGGANPNGRTRAMLHDEVETCWREKY